ncbi:protein eva-1-like [Tachypleus tridentatus]|uniref:protein eva-1-like n=1 Tax=Tachypleus tridentatus TaxID=6853 RepID=UPI003FD05410
MTRTGSHIKFYLVFWTLILTNVLEMLTADNLPLLSGTLRTFQVHACDGNELRIECFPDTVISINLVHYGRSLSSNNLCPPKSPKVAFSLKNNTSACLAADALKAVEAVCREQRVCKMKTSPETLGGDPCPGIRKYAEVAYKCRPSKSLYSEFSIPLFNIAR